jgi:hypothetical protein
LGAKLQVSRCGRADADVRAQMLSHLRKLHISLAYNTAQTR